jgi:hypothetical protein
MFCIDLIGAKFYDKLYFEAQTSFDLSVTQKNSAIGFIKYFKHCLFLPK